MTELSLEQAVQLADQNARDGNWAQAETLYRQVAAYYPDQAEIHFNLGMVLAHSGRLAEAVDVLKQAVSLKPDLAIAHSNLGNVLQLLGRFDEALIAFRRTVELLPDLPDTHTSLGNALYAKNELELALFHYQKATQIDSKYAAAYVNIGDLQRRLKRLDDAQAACQRAIELRPDLAEGHINLGNVLLEKEQYPAAIAAFDSAIQIRCTDTLAHNNRGLALAQLGRLEEAIVAHQNAIKLDPHQAASHSGLAQTLHYMLRFDQAIAAYHTAISLEPENPDHHWNLALVLLENGNFAEGWQEFDWGAKGVLRILGRTFDAPEWAGEDLSGKTLLVHDAGGYGDALQYVRYALLLRGRPARLLLETKTAMIPLFAGIAGIEIVPECGEKLPDSDYQIALQSLPRLFKTDLTNIPSRVPYLDVPEEYRTRWRSRINGGGLKVGLVWSGATHDRYPENRRLKSADFFAALSQVDGVQFFSLQKGPRAGDPRPAEMNMIDVSDELENFADTAAVVEQLDLVISVDTSVVHLAGALGKPVWVVLPHRADFRWLRDRTDSPWYPTARLFRQTSPGNYAGQLTDIVAALNELRARR